MEVVLKKKSESHMPNSALNLVTVKAKYCTDTDTRLVTLDKYLDFVRMYIIYDKLYVIFLQEPRYYNNLDISESKWIKKLKATININRTF